MNMNDAEGGCENRPSGSEQGIISMRQHDRATDP